MRTLSPLLALLTLASCSHLSGYHSRAAPKVMVVSEESALRPSGVASTITVIRPNPGSLMEVVDALLTRVEARGGRYVTGLEAQWTESREEGTYRCGARLRPVVVSGVEGSEPGREAKGSAEAQAYGLRSWGEDNTLPSDRPLRRPNPRDVRDLGIAGASHRKWGLGMTEPACVGTPDPANDRIILEGSYY